MLKTFRRLVATETLSQVDPEISEIIKNETKRQINSIVLIPSENFASLAVRQALSSIMQNKYSEGYPNARYYGGNQFIDQAELLCQERALDLFGLNSSKWGVNVQPLSGAPANLYVYSALMKPHDRLMGLDLPHGGHLSHGYQTPTKKISAVSTYFETLPYRVNVETGRVDYQELLKTALLYRPKIIVGGASAYPREWDYAQLRDIADKTGSHLLFDMAHTSGLIAAKVMHSPFDYADVVTTTTHKSLRGPRGAMIFYRKGVKSFDKKGNPVNYNLQGPIDFSVFPGHQGGPHNHTITALAVALKLAKQPSFINYQTQVLKNAKQMEKYFKSKNYKLVSDGTDSHLLLIDLRSKKIDGARVERILEMVNIAVNKNTVPGDVSALIPSGIRVGAPAMTSRGLKEDDFDVVCAFINEIVELTVEIDSCVVGKKLSDFKEFVGEDGNTFKGKIDGIKQRVVEFTSKFETFGIE